MNGELRKAWKRIPKNDPQTFYIVEKYSIMEQMTMGREKAMTFQELMDCWDRGTYNCNRAVYDKILEYAAGYLIPFE